MQADQSVSQYQKEKLYEIYVFSYPYICNFVWKV